MMASLFTNFGENIPFQYGKEINFSICHVQPLRNTALMIFREFHWTYILVPIVNFKQIPHIVLVFNLLTLNS